MDYRIVNSCRRRPCGTIRFSNSSSIESQVQKRYFTKLLNPFFPQVPDGPTGHLIAHKIEEQMKKAGSIGSEFERMAKIGSVAPDLWMKNATGAPVGPEALLLALERSLAAIGTEKGL